MGRRAAARERLAGRPANRAIVVVVALLLAACGSRLSGDERAQAIAALERGPADGRSSGVGEPVVGDTETVTGGGGATPGPTGTAAPTDAPVANEAAGGGQADACRPGSATGPGVTPTELRVGNVSQMSGLIPGLARTSVNGVAAYFNYVNNQGGVCGRRLNLVRADDRFQAATNRGETEKLADSVIAFAGSFSAVDDGGAPVLDAKGIADVSLAITPPRIAARNNFSPNPIDPTPGAGSGVAPALSYFKQAFGAQHGAIFYQDVASSVNQLKSFRADFENAGFPLEAVYPVAPTATNFRSQALDMKQKGIDLVVTIAEVNAMANLARAFGDVGYFPKVPYYGAQTYGQKFIQLAGGSAEGAMAALIFTVPEEATPASATMRDWYRRTAPGHDLDYFSLQAWVAGEMLVTALRAAGPDPTQQKVIAELRKLTRFESGMVAPINPAEKKASRCFHVVEVKNGAWVKQFPESGFHCQGA